MKYTESFSISDPLYELGVFRMDSGRDIYSEIFGGREEFGILYERLINSFELNRLNFLKQAGLLFLSFPSATHSRFAHSLGCFTLGTYALEHMWVKQNKSMIRLEKYLKQKKMREEFLIAHLVHDIGHLPFSHYLEENESIKKAYKDHEAITAEFLTADSELYSRLTEEADKLESETIVRICKDLREIDIKKIKYLLAEENKDPASQLVCGYLDLDRLDHYYRDSFFMGLKLASVNIKGFLDAIVIDHETDSSRFFLRSEGVPHILHLLFGKEMLWQRAFDTDINRAYQSMFIRAVDKWIESKKNTLEKIPFMTEDTLMDELRTCESSRRLTDLIFSRRPYALAWKEEDSNMTLKELKAKFKNWVEKEANDKNDFLLFAPKNFQKGETIINEWLMSDIPIFEGGSLSSIHSDLFNYFQRQAVRRLKTFRIFAKDNKLAEATATQLRKEFH